MHACCVKISANCCGIDEGVEVYGARECRVAVCAVHGNCLKIGHAVLVWNRIRLRSGVKVKIAAYREYVAHVKRSRHPDRLTS